MGSVLSGFATIAIIIGVGALLAHLGVLDLAAQKVLANVAFTVATPALLLTTIAGTDVRVLLSHNLIASAASAVVAGGLYAVVARLAWRRTSGDLAIGAATSAYVNSANLGIPVAAYVLGNAALVAPTLLLQLLVIQPIMLAVLDAERSGRRPSPWSLVRTTLTNPVTAGTLIGLALSLTGWSLPNWLGTPLQLIGAIAIPGMLLAYGVALRLGPGLGGDLPKPELALTTALKLVGQPVVAYAVAHFLLGVTGPALLAIVVIAALPTAQNIFIIATRYDRSTVLARDTILLTTLGSMPVILAITLLLGH